MISLESNNTENKLSRRPVLQKMMRRASLLLISTGSLSAASWLSQSGKSHCYSLKRLFSVGYPGTSFALPSLETAEMAMQGRREYMEDEHFISQDKRLVGVFDGHAGPSVSKFVKSKFDKYFKEVLDNKPQTQPLENQLVTSQVTESLYSDEAIKEAFLLSTRRLDDEVGAHKVLRSQGSTFCSVYVNRKIDTTTIDAQKDHFSIISCNIGDSRSVLCRSGKAIDLTMDHKPELPQERARVEKLGGHVKWFGKTKDGKPVLDTGVYRINGNLALSRAIGDHREKPFVVSTPDIKVIPGDWANDQFIICATDGFWDVFSSEVAVALVQEILKISESEDEKLRAGGELLLPAELKKESDELDLKLAQAEVEEKEQMDSISDEQFQLMSSLGKQMADGPPSARKDAASGLSSESKQKPPLSPVPPTSLVQVARMNMARYLCIEAFRQGSYDNISAVIIWLK